MTIQIDVNFTLGVIMGFRDCLFFSPGNKYFFFNLKINFVPYLAIKIAKVILTKGRTFFCGGRGQGGVNPS